MLHGRALPSTGVGCSRGASQLPPAPVPATAHRTPAFETGAGRESALAVRLYLFCRHVHVPWGLLLCCCRVVRV